MHRCPFCAVFRGMRPEAPDANKIVVDVDRDTDESTFEVSTWLFLCCKVCGTRMKECEAEWSFPIEGPLKEHLQTARATGLAHFLDFKILRVETLDYHLDADGKPIVLVGSGREVSNRGARHMYGVSVSVEVHCECQPPSVAWQSLIECTKAGKEFFEVFPSGSHETGGNHVGGAEQDLGKASSQKQRNHRDQFGD